MNRLMRHLLALSVVVMSAAQASESFIVPSEAAGPFEVSASFIEKRLPWLHSKLTDFRRILAEKPAAPVVRPKAAEEVSLQFSHAWASHGFDMRGRKSDPSAVAFGSGVFTVQDAFVASRLLARDEAKIVSKIADQQPLPNNNNHYLCLLADQKIAFKGHESRQEFLGSYSRAFLDKRLQMSIDLPLVRRETHLSVEKMSPANRAALVDAASLNVMRRGAMADMRTPEVPGFYELHSDLDGFLHQTLENSGITFAEKQETVGLGDFSIKCMYDHAMPYVDHCQVGAELVLNTSKGPHNVALAEPVLGHGAHQIKTHARFEWHRSSYANPCVIVGLGYSIPSQVGMRLPYSLSHDGMSNMGSRLAEVSPHTIPFSDVVMLGGSPFSNYAETMIPGFASTLHKVTIHKGLSCLFQLGNTIEECFGKPMHVTFAYRFVGQQQERISGLEDSHQYALDIATKHTGSRTHSVHTSVGYRLSALCSVEGAIDHVFSGKNTLKDTRISGGVVLRF